MLDAGLIFCIHYFLSIVVCVLVERDSALRWNPDWSNLRGNVIFLEVWRFGAEFEWGSFVVAFAIENCASFLRLIVELEVSEAPRLVWSILVQSRCEYDLSILIFVIEDFVDMEFGIWPVSSSAEVPISSLNNPLSLPNVYPVNLREEPLVIPRVNLIDCKLHPETLVRRDAESLCGCCLSSENVVPSDHRLASTLADGGASLIVSEGPAINSSELVFLESLVQ